MHRVAFPWAAAGWLFLAGALTAQEPTGSASVWTHDFAAAQRLARAEPPRDLLLFFTGSDWCGWCKKLKADVLDQQAFLDAVTSDYVLVELDYPRDTSILSEATVRQNEELRARYRPGGYPFVVLADADGRPYEVLSGYVAGGPEVYLQRLREGREKRDRVAELHRRAIDSTDEAVRASLLREALGLLPAGVGPTFYADWQSTVDAATASADLSTRELAEAFLADRRNGRFRDDAAAERSAYGKVYDALTAEERTEVERGLAIAEIQAGLTAFGMNQGGRGAGATALDAAKVHEAIARMLAARQVLGAWPRGALGNRALIAVADWADRRGDILLFAKVVEELPAAREGLAGTPEIMAFFEKRLAALRAGTAEDAFMYAFLNRRGEAPPARRR